MSNQLRNETLKLRNTKIVWLSCLISLGIVLFAGMNLFATGRIDDFNADPDTGWSTHLIGYCTALALLSPLQLALMASRSADLEHSGGGWLLNATHGIRAGTVVRWKLVILTILLLVIKLVESGVLFGMPVLLGAPAPDIEMTRSWVTTSFGAYATSVALLAIFLWLASRIESQLVVLSVGVVGGFLGVAAMLSPPWFAAMNPFGYYALVTPFTFSESGVVTASPSWALWSVYLFLSAVAFCVLTRKLSEKEI